jgi:hypothetical protein
MFKKAISILVACLFVAAMTGFVFAADETAPATAPAMTGEKPAAAGEAKPAEAKPAKKSKKSKKAAEKTMAGTVKSVDAAANTITIEKKGKETSFETTDKTKVTGAKDMSEIAAGDKVTVKYHEKEGKMIAESIKKATAAKKGMK